MSALTRWVLAHKKTVVLTWVALTVAGVMAADAAIRPLPQREERTDRRIRGPVSALYVDVSLDTGQTIADPLVSSRPYVRMLEMRAAGLQPVDRSGSRDGQLRGPDEFRTRDWAQKSGRDA